MLDVVASNSGIFLVADPGFPRGGCANSPWGGGGCQHTILPKFPKKLHEIERIWTQRGVLMLPLDPPLITDFDSALQSTSSFSEMYQL